MGHLNRRNFLAATGAAAAAPGLAACGGSDSEGSSGSLQFVLSGDANQGGGFAAMAEKYLEETGVEIEIVDLPYDDLNTRVRNSAQANDLPALARMPALDPVWIERTIDLSDIADAVNPIDGMYAEAEDGKVMAMASDLTAVGLFLNRSLWDEAGVDYPTSLDDTVWTWDEFVDAATAVREGTGVRFAMAMDRSAHRLNSFLYQMGSEGVLLTKDLSAYEADDALVPALEYFAELNDDEFMPRSVWLSGEDPNAMFKTGQVAAYYSGSWQIADFAENIADFEWVSVPSPAQSKQATNYGPAALIAAFEGSGQEEEARAFVEWLYQPKNYSEICEISGFLPVVSDLDINYGDQQNAFDLYNEEIAASPQFIAEANNRDLELQALGTATDLGTEPLEDEAVKVVAGDKGAEQAVDTVLEDLNGSLA